MKFPFAAILAGLAAGVMCFAADNEKAEAGRVKTLAQGAFSAIYEPELKVIKDAAEWADFWKKHSARKAEPDPAPKVDFEKEMVIAATLGRRNTGGYKIEIERVREEDKKLKVLIRKSSPPKGAMTIQSLTAPFHFVAAPRSELKPELVEVEASAKAPVSPPDAR
jgi:hypothetical protein